jgi:hypothetical protein
MKNKMKIVVLAMLVGILAFGLVLVSCNEKPSLIGIWELDRVENGPREGIVSEFVLFKDGTGDMGDGIIKWETKNNHITVTAFGETQSWEYILTGSTLTIIYDESTGHRAIYNRYVEYE